MKTKLPSRGWSLKTVLLVSATAPAFVVLLVFSVSLYYFRSEEIRSELDEHGSLLAHALAEASTYGVVSGNVDALRSAAKGLLSSDRGIARVEVFDAQRSVLVAVVSSDGDMGSERAFERAVHAQQISIDLFSGSALPHLTVPGAAPLAESNGRVLGYARVSMSLQPLAQARGKFIRTTSFILCLAGVIGWLFALRFTAELRASFAAILGALRKIRHGNFEIASDGTIQGEIGELQDALVDVARALKKTTSELELRVEQRTTELRNAVRVAEQSVDEKRQLIADGVQRLEDERRRIAVEIHDTMNSALIVVRMKAQHIEHLASDDPHTPCTAEIRKSALAITDGLDSLYRSTREIVNQLRPEIIDMLGLKGALSELIRSYDSFHPHCRFRLLAPHGFPLLTPDTSIAAYRLVQECLSNIVKHARASLALVELVWVEDQDLVRLVVKDDGLGFDSSTPASGGLGLIGMRERVTTLGGAMRLVTNPGAGTEVWLELPASAAARRSAVP